MAFVLTDGQGTLHKNKNKEEGSKQPDYRGDVMLGGVMYDIGAWLKDGKGGKWMSLKVEPKRYQAAQPTRPPSPDTLPDLPF